MVGGGNVIDGTKSYVDGRYAICKEPGTDRCSEPIHGG